MAVHVRNAGGAGLLMKARCRVSVNGRPEPPDSTAQHSRSSLDLKNRPSQPPAPSGGGAWWWWAAMVVVVVVARFPPHSSCFSRSSSYSSSTLLPLRPPHNIYTHQTNLVITSRSNQVGRNTTKEYFSRCTAKINLGVFKK